MEQRMSFSFAGRRPFNLSSESLGSDIFFSFGDFFADRSGGLMPKGYECKRPTDKIKARLAEPRWAGQARPYETKATSTPNLKAGAMKIDAEPSLCRAPETTYLSG